MKRTRILAAGLFVVAAACSGGDTTSTTTTDDATITADISSAAADGIAEDVDVMQGMDGTLGHSGGASLMGPGDWRPGLTGCTFLNGSFNCPDTLRNGLNVTRTITFLDAQGVAESAFDPLLTASIHIVADISGDRTHGPWTANVTRHRDLTITGLAGTETTRTVNGTGNETVDNSRDTNNPRAYNLTCSSNITNVVLPVRTTDGGNGWPVSGTIQRTCTITVTAGPNAGKTTTRTVTITFDGTATPTANINGTTFTIDLSNHTATKH